MNFELNTNEKKNRNRVSSCVFLLKKGKHAITWQGTQTQWQHSCGECGRMEKKMEKIYINKHHFEPLQVVNLTLINYRLVFLKYAIR